MMHLKLKMLLALLGIALTLNLTAADSPAVYSANFETNALGNVPEDMLVLDGAFTVVAGADGNKLLELPGSPLETYGLLFGPTEAAGLSVQARIQGTGTGRRFPVFGVGLNGVAGFRLRVAPAKKLLELYKGDDPITTAPFPWESGSWTVLRLEQVKVKDGEFLVRGKAWKHGEKEPADWSIKHTITTETPAGRPSIWGFPYAGTPIQFDDLRVTAVK